MSYDAPRESDSGGPQATPAVVEDLFLTDAFLIKGRMSGKYHRLSKVLEDYERTFVSIEDAVLISLRGHDTIRTPRIHVNVREILLAHELVDLGGDDKLRALSADDKSTRIRAFYNGGVQLELSGRIAPGAYEPSRGAFRRWMVLAEPTVRGLNVEGRPELGVLDGLGYAIVQKSRLSYVYDFG